MLRAALTGGIGTGKTYVSVRLREAGIPVVDADVLARDVVRPGTPGLAEVRERFGEGVIATDGTLNRPALAAIVFEDEAARRDLERIIHPRVRDSIETFYAQLPAGVRVAVADIPLLFETGREGKFSPIIVAACPPDVQLERVMHRDGMTRDDAERRIAAQWPIDDKVSRADIVIRTGGTFDETDRQVRDLADELRRLAAR